MAKWTAFPYADPAYAYTEATLKKHWARLHKGDCEPLPKDRKVLDAWLAYHRGDFEQALELGLAAGLPGYNPAKDQNFHRFTIDYDVIAVLLIIAPTRLVHEVELPVFGFPEKQHDMECVTGHRDDRLQLFCLRDLLLHRQAGIHIVLVVCRGKNERWSSAGNDSEAAEQDTHRSGATTLFVLIMPTVGLVEQFKHLGNHIAFSVGQVSKVNIGIGLDVTVCHTERAIGQAVGHFDNVTGIALPDERHGGGKVEITGKSGAGRVAVNNTSPLNEIVSKTRKPSDGFKPFHTPFCQIL